MSLVCLLCFVDCQKPRRGKGNSWAGGSVKEFLEILSCGERNLQISVTEGSARGIIFRVKALAREILPRAPKMERQNTKNTNTQI